MKLQDTGLKCFRHFEILQVPIPEIVIGHILKQRLWDSIH